MAKSPISIVRIPYFRCICRTSWAWWVISEFFEVYPNLVGLVRTESLWNHWSFWRNAEWWCENNRGGFRFIWSCKQSYLGWKNDHTTRMLCRRMHAIITFKGSQLKSMGLGEGGCMGSCEVTPKPDGKPVGPKSDNPEPVDKSWVSSECKVVDLTGSGLPGKPNVPFFRQLDCWIQG